MKVAITGKGGVGKTFIAGCLACAFVRRGWQTMAIDADSSPNLALTLGLSADEARTLIPLCDDKDLVRMKTDSGFEGVYRLSFTVDDIIRSHAVKTPAGVHLLVMGTVRGMGTGCTCPANALVRALLRSLLVKDRQAVILDMEAGVEHLGRGTAEHVDVMLVITDVTQKSLETARNIRGIAAAAGIDPILLVGNRISDAGQENRLTQFSQENSFPILAIIPHDPRVLEAEIKGVSPLFQPESSAIKAIGKLADTLLRRIS